MLMACAEWLLRDLAKRLLLILDEPTAYRSAEEASRA
jgi:hypothetical protein